MIALILAAASAAVFAAEPSPVQLSVAVSPAVRTVFDRYGVEAPLTYRACDLAT